MKAKTENQTPLTSILVIFLVITACITIMEGILGSIFLPDIRFGYEAFFSPPLFGLLSTLTELVKKSKKELSVRQVLFRDFLQLLLIEAIVFGLNLLCGNVFTPALAVSLAVGIAVSFLFVYWIIWMNDRKMAHSFNIALKEFQESQKQDSPD